MGRIAIAAAILATLYAPAARGGDFVSRSYEFKPNRVLDVGLDLGNGLRLESIEFVVSQKDESGATPLLDQPRAKVTIANLGKEGAKIGIAVAVVDADGRLVAAGTGGTKLFPLRAERKMTYTIGFDDVTDRVGSGTAFQISLETKP